MSHRLLKILAAFTPAKLEAWRRLILTLIIFFLVLLLFVLAVAVILVWTLTDLDKLGYGPEFFILLMKFLKPSI
jgi:hypothetical protein